MENNVQVFYKITFDKVSRRYFGIGDQTSAEKKQVLKDAGSGDRVPCFQ